MNGQVIRAYRTDRRAFLRGGASLAAGAAGLSLVGCGDDDDGTTSPTGAGSDASTAPSAPKPGGKLVLSQPRDPVSLDMYKTWNAATIALSSYVYAQLLKWKTGPDVGPLDWISEPDLATGLPEQPDDTTYTFKLRENAKWEDKPPANGRALVADDVVQNFKRFRQLHPNRNLFADVLRAVAVDEHTVNFTLSKPLGPFINHMTHMGMFWVLNPEIVESAESEKDFLACGPFVLESFNVGTSMVFKRNPDYFGAPRPYLDSVEYIIIGDAATTQSSYRSGDLDTISVTDRSVAESLVGQLAGSHRIDYPNQSNYWLGMDLRNPIFKDKRVRQAVSLAVNREQLLKIYGGDGQRAVQYGILPTWYVDPSSNKFGNNGYLYDHDVKRAKDLLAAAGVSELGSLPMVITRVLRQEGAVQEAELLRVQLRELGAEIKLVEQEFAQFYANVINEAKWEHGFAVAQNLVGADPNEYYSVFWEPDSPRIIAPGLADIIRGDTQVTKLMEDQRRELDFDRRHEIVRELTNTLSERMYNVPLIIPNGYFIANPRLENLNWVFGYAPGGQWVSDLWVEA